MTGTPLVSVVIPAYNAAATLDETLRSVRSQTHRTLEIIVVNDGSSDATQRLAEQHAALDHRVQVIAQQNAGIAAARNSGWRHARAELIAFIDADDLWAPAKIEFQLQALQAGGERVGLVYCWSARLTSSGETIGAWEGARCEGEVLSQIFTGNFIGNGSSALVRRAALVYAGGFDSRLREADAEGCEDYLFYCRAAEKYQFAVVPEHLTGYRHLPHSMSANRLRMLRSWMLVFDQMLARHPGNRDALRSGLRNYLGWLVADAVSKGEFKQLPPLLSTMTRHSPSIAIKVALTEARLALTDKVRVRLLRSLRRTTQPTRVETATRTGRRFPIGELD